MPAAQIQFSQGVTTTPAGQSALGYVTGTQVNFTDAAGGGATSWQWTIVGFPGPFGSPPTINNASSQTANITDPLLDGMFIIKLVRTDPGPVVTTDVKFFAVGDTDFGFVLPSAGMTGAMTNIGGSTAAQQAGWEGRADASTNVFLDGLLRLLRSIIGRFVGLPVTVNSTSSSPTSTPIRYGKDQSWRVINMTGSGTYTEEIRTTGAPQIGGRFKYRVNMTAGAGNFILHSGIGGSTIVSLPAPPSGTFTYGLEVAFDGTNWTRTYLSAIDPLVLPHSQSFDAVVGLQSTSQIVATRIGSVRIDPSKFPSNAQITFQVAVDTTGPQVTVQLYNLTDSGIVSGSVLTSTSSTTAFLTSSALSLPNAQKDYEVQMFIASGGGPSDHGDCTSAKVILTWA